MNDIKVTIGGPIEEDAARGFVDAWHRAERGESFHERHLAFESWDTLARVLTGKRMELLRYVRRHRVVSIRAPWPRRSAATTAMFTRMSRR
jgi:predicted transcriptional regulator